VKFLLNDLSIDGQFSDIITFRHAIEKVMEMRRAARQYGSEILCHRNVLSAQVTYNLKMQQVIQSFSIAEKQAFLQWVTRSGPFWDEERLHSSDEYLNHDGNIVTDSALAEAAICCHNGLNRQLVSLTPSSWEFSPIPVEWVQDASASHNFDVFNHWDQDTFEAALSSVPTPIHSWHQLEQTCIVRCPALTFAPDCFAPLDGQPFVVSAAERIRVLLDTLECFRRCIDSEGRRTPEGQYIIEQHFSGEKAWFSDSSDTEKRDFKKELNFNKTGSGESLSCTWHGKVKTPQLRIHFSWPVNANEVLYVAYVGPKITKR
jgi:hypothetical protein